METTDAACHEAMQWVTRLHAEGSTSVLQALLASSTPEPDPVARQRHHPPIYGYCAVLYSLLSVKALRLPNRPVRNGFSFSLYR